MERKTIETRPQVQRLESTLKRLRHQAARYPEAGALVAFLVVFLGFSLTAEHFLTIQSFAGMLAVIAELGIVTVGISLLMISGEFDLSVGSVLAVSSMSFALLLRADIPVIPALILALIFAALLGLLNGLIVVITNIPSFITTLGTMMFWRGILLAITGGTPVAYFKSNLVFQVLNSRFIADFRTSALWFLLTVIAFHFLLKHTRYGNWVRNRRKRRSS